MDNKFIKIKSLLEEADEMFWERERDKVSLNLFKLASNKVPAYKDFLEKNGLNSKEIKSWKDSKRVPTSSKKNYLKVYPLNELCWDGTLNNKAIIFTSTSGSTGKPVYFPREKDLDWQYSIIIESFLENQPVKGPTLIIVGFGLGVWIGGVITYKAFEITSQRGNYPVSIITPGINKEEIFNALEKLAPNFENTILVGYPPFIKDVIDESVQKGINLEKLKLRLVFAAEAFNENFRQYIVSAAGIQNPCLDTMNIYGSADIGAMAAETPISILIRKLAIAKPELFKEIFGDIKKTPTLAQFNPTFINFECIDGELILTGNNTVPLIRYAIGDSGGVLTYSEIMDKIKAVGINIEDETEKAGIAESTITKIPFVFVYERNDFSTTLYGLSIYPEIVREVLIEEPFNRYLTGKLTLMTKFTDNQDQYLEINIELKKNNEIAEEVKKFLMDRIVNNLCLKNSEFRELSTYLKERARPKLVFWTAEDPTHFRPGIKQSWVKK